MRGKIKDVLFGCVVIFVICGFLYNGIAHRFSHRAKENHIGMIHIHGLDLPEIRGEIEPISLDYYGYIEIINDGKDGEPVEIHLYTE